MPILWLALLSACDDTTFKSHVEAVEGEGIEGVVAVFESNCVSCHQGPNASAGLALDGDLCDSMIDVEASSGAGVLVVPGSRDDSVLYQRIVDELRPMPPGGIMPESNTEIVGQWIDDGADCGEQASGGAETGGEESGGDDGPGPSEGPEAATTIIMDNHCASCHSGGSPIGGFGVEVDLCDQLVNQVGNSGMTLVVPGDADGSLLVQRMLDEASPMPPNGLLGQSDIDTVKDWINAGAECGESSSETEGGGGLEDTGMSSVMGMMNPEMTPDEMPEGWERGVVQ